MEHRPMGIKLGVLPAGWGNTALLPHTQLNDVDRVFNPRGGLYLRMEESKKAANSGGWGAPVIHYMPGC
jgi:hypothetical protein